MFFIHGDKDTYVPTWMVYPLYEAKPNPKELWIVPGAKHAVSYKENKTEYTVTTINSLRSRRLWYKKAQNKYIKATS